MIAVLSLVYDDILIYYEHMHDGIYSLEGDIDKMDIGGKARGLSTLYTNGAPVPQGFIITDRVNIFESKDAIIHAFKQLKAKRVAVRSSALNEDSKEASWAGQFDTILNVTDDGLIKAIQQCRDSLHNKRAATYDDMQTSMTVLVQVMVDADISGVLFTANPITSSNDEMIIEAVYGLGELLVQGLTTPESLIVNKITGEVTSRIKHQQTEQIIFDGATVTRPLTKKQAISDILNENHLKRLQEFAIQAEKIFEAPQDIEWCFKKNQLYILQSRPITAFG